MSPFDNREFDGHELVVFGNDEPTALRAIIAVHSTALGPAAGGCRMWPYASRRRSRDGCAPPLARHELQERDGRPALRRRQGRDHRRLRAARRPRCSKRSADSSNSLGGRYITAEDVGTTTADMESVARHTRFVTGLHRRPGEFGGDPVTEDRARRVPRHQGRREIPPGPLGSRRACASRFRASAASAITSAACSPRKA